MTALLSVVPAMFISGSFLADFQDFLLLVLYFFIPWTAVNLVDYYVVRKGHYAIAEIFNPNGMYGRWGWRGIVSYLVGFVAMSPFFVIGTWYTGFLGHKLNDVDISLFIGLPISGLLYCVPRPVDRRGRRDPGRRGGGRASSRRVAGAHATA